MRTLEFDTAQRALILVDQTRLPREIVLVTCRTAEDVAHAIRSMQVRGAPAIGVAAAYGMALAAAAAPSSNFLPTLEDTADMLGKTRPTAVNLQWALDRVLSRAKSALNHEAVDTVRQAVLDMAHQLAEE